MTDETASVPEGPLGTGIGYTTPEDRARREAISAMP